MRYTSNGVQNGPDDWVALVDPKGQLVQFLSYEGAITGGDGPAAGVTSQNLPVSESNSSAVGSSLQLTGTGSSPANFSWAGSSAQTFDACNRGQTFNGSGGETGGAPTQGATGFPAAGDLAVGFSEAVTLSSGAFALSCASSGTVALSYPTNGTRFTLSSNTALVGGERCTLAITASAIRDAAGLSPAANQSLVFTVASTSGGTGYYTRVNTANASQLRCSLHTLIKSHTVYPHSGTGTNIWTILEMADEDPNNSGRILDAYRNRSYAKVSDRAGTGSGLTYNREHTWPDSLGFGSASGDKGLPYAPYTDTHMLYLTDTTFNADRGNKPYAACTSSCGERVTEINNGTGGGSARYPGNSNWVRTPVGNRGTFEVWPRRKGDMARAVMYMAIRFEGGTDAATGQSEPDLELTDDRSKEDRSKIVQTSSSPAYMGLPSTLLAWHQADPPDDAERARNQVIFSFQGNRNPFVDHPV